MPVGELLNRISASELNEWEAFFNVVLEAENPEAYLKLRAQRHTAEE